MARRIGLLALTLACALAVGPHAAATERFDDVAKWVERFEDPQRKDWQRPGQLMLILGLDYGDRVADIGTGTGYFLPALSNLVGEFGKVYAVDVEPGLLQYVDSREDLVVGNVETVLADPDDPKLPDQSVDLILLVNTWHHIKKRARYLPKLQQALRPGGRVAIVDWIDSETEIGPPAKKRLAKAKVIGEFSKAGMLLAAESFALPYQYTLIFIRESESEPRRIPMVEPSESVTPLSLGTGSAR